MINIVKRLVFKVRYPFVLRIARWGFVYIPAIFFLLASTTIIICGLEGYKRIYMFILEVRLNYICSKGKTVYVYF